MGSIKDGPAGYHAVSHGTTAPAKRATRPSAPRPVVAPVVSGGGSDEKADVAPSQTALAPAPATAARPGVFTPPAPVPAAPAAAPSPRTGEPVEIARPAAPAGKATPEAASLAQTEASARMLAEGDRLFASGDVVKARERYLGAMNGPIPEVMLAFGRSFDPYYLAKLPRANAGPDVQRAITIYEGAVRQGAKQAEADLERLRKSMASGAPAAGTDATPRAAPQSPATAGQPAAGAAVTPAIGGAGTTPAPPAPPANPPNKQ